MSLDEQMIVPVLIAGLMPYVFTSIAKVGAFSPGENHRTRDWQAELEGWRKRAHWAQQNSFEVFPPFAIGALLARSEAPESMLGLGLAWAFVATRVLFGLCYLKDWARLRTLSFFAGAGCMIGLYVVALIGG